MRWKTFPLFALAIACAEPTRPESPLGVWTLVAVDASLLPATIVSDVEIVSGRLELKADGTYEEVTQTRVAGTLVHGRVQGDWRSSGRIVEFLDRVVGLPFVGYWNGSSLEVQEELAMKYAR